MTHHSATWNLSYKLIAIIFHTRRFSLTMKFRLPYHNSNYLPLRSLNNTGSRFGIVSEIKVIKSYYEQQVLKQSLQSRMFQIQNTQHIVWKKWAGNSDYHRNKCCGRVAVHAYLSWPCRKSFHLRPKIIITWFKYNLF